MAMQGNESAQEPGQIIADRQTQSRTAILAADIDIRLFKGFEDQIMLLRGNADSGILHLKGNPLLRSSPS